MRRYHMKATVWGIGLFSLLLLLTMTIISRVDIALDRNIAEFVQQYESVELTKVMELFSFIGSTIPVAVIAVIAMIIFYTVLKHRVELLFFIMAVGGAAIFNKLFKWMIKRERPDFYRLIEEAGYSFPSGHTMGALALYGALTFLLWRHVRSRSGRAAIIGLGCFMVVAIAVSRIYLGVHYPSDIAGGLLASGLWLTLSIAIFRRYIEQRQDLLRGLVRSN